MSARHDGATAPEGPVWERLLDQLRLLHVQIKSEQIGGAAAQVELRNLKDKLDRLREEIEAKKVTVVPVQVHTDDEEMTFEPGRERVLVITAERLLPDTSLIQTRVERLLEATTEKIDRFSDPFLVTP